MLPRLDTTGRIDPPSAFARAQRNARIRSEQDERDEAAVRLAVVVALVTFVACGFMLALAVLQ
jgi:hypothetical protein